MDSILDSIKQVLGIPIDDTSFDRDLIIYINGALPIVNQLGFGKDGYTISGKSNLWSEFSTEQSILGLVKNVISLRVRLIFDPPQNSFLVTAIEKQIQEYDWRIMVGSAEVPEV